MRVHSTTRSPLPRALNSLGVWFGLMVALTFVNYGYPIAQSFFLQHNAVPAQIRVAGTVRLGMNPFGDRLGAVGWLVAGLVAVAAFLIGFVWLPSLQAARRAAVGRDLSRGGHLSAIGTTAESDTACPGSRPP